MTDLSHNISVITLNVNGLNAQTKGQRLKQWTKKMWPNYILPRRNSLQHIGGLKVKGWEKALRSGSSYVNLF